MQFNSNHLFTMQSGTFPRPPTRPLARTIVDRHLMAQWYLTSTIRILEVQLDGQLDE